MSILKEFRQFITKGNVLELAVGVIIGGAFNKIVSSLIEDIITPLILSPLLNAAHVHRLEDYTWHNSKPGMFMSSVITFLLTGFVLFLIVRLINRIRERDTDKDQKKSTLNTTEQLLTEIRDEMRSQRRV
jgi:large conductance mechanosensitive channel